MNNREIVKFLKKQDYINAKLWNSIQKLDNKLSFSQSFFAGTLFGIISVSIIYKSAPYLRMFFNYLFDLFNSMTPDGKINLIVIVPTTVIVTLLVELIIRKTRTRL